MKNKLLLLATGIVLSAQILMAQVPSYVPTNGLVGYWPFNGNANDESGNGNNGTVNGATLTTDRFGNANSAYSFNGTSNYIQVAHNSIFDFETPNSITISSWIKTSMTTGAVIVQKQSGVGATQNGVSCGILDTNGYLHGVSKKTNGTQSLISHPASGFNNNNWHHFVYTFSAGVAKIYLDGALLNSQTNTGSTIANSTTNLIFGYGLPLNNFYYNGKLDDIGIWNRALSQAEITAMYNGVTYSDSCNNVSGSLTQGLVGYWPFCGNANDDSGNGNNGTVNGATLTTDRFGNANSAYSFDGLNDIINLPLNSGQIANSSQFTIQYWILPDETITTSQTVFANWHSVPNVPNGTPVGFYSGFYGNNSGYNIFTGYVNNFGVGSNSNINFSNWNHVIIVFDGSQTLAQDRQKVFLNGILQSNNFSCQNCSTNIPQTIGNIFNHTTIGARYVGPENTLSEKFKGNIDDIGIWNRALSEEEITNLYNANQCITNITVTDTLIINVGQLSFNDPVTWANNITIFPNPASTEININFNNITNLDGGTLKVINSLGQEVATTPITTSGTQSIMQFSTWGGTGMYFVQIINPQGQIVDIKKIILQ